MRVYDTYDTFDTCFAYFTLSLSSLFPFPLLFFLLSRKVVS
jgi:hypothetical protein